MSDVSWNSDRGYVHPCRGLIGVALGEIILKKWLRASTQYVAISNRVSGVRRCGLGRHLMHGRQSWDSYTRDPHSRHTNSRRTGNGRACHSAKATLSNGCLDNRCTSHGVVTTARGALSHGDRRAYLDRYQGDAAQNRQLDHSLKSHSIHSCARDALFACSRKRSTVIDRLEIQDDYDLRQHLIDPSVRKINFEERKPTSSQRISI